MLIRIWLLMSVLTSFVVIFYIYQRILKLYKSEKFSRFNPVNISFEMAYGKSIRFP